MEPLDAFRTRSAGRHVPRPRRSACGAEASRALEAHVTGAGSARGAPTAWDQQAPRVWEVRGRPAARAGTGAAWGRPCGWRRLRPDRSAAVGAEAGRSGRRLSRAQGRKRSPLFFLRTAPRLKPHILPRLNALAPLPESELFEFSGTICTRIFFLKNFSLVFEDWTSIAKSLRVSRKHTQIEPSRSVKVGVNYPRLCRGLFHY